MNEPPDNLHYDLLRKTHLRTVKSLRKARLKLDRVAVVYCSCAYGRLRHTGVNTTSGLACEKCNSTGYLINPRDRDLTLSYMGVVARYGDNVPKAALEIVSRECSVCHHKFTGRGVDPCPMEKYHA